MKNPFDYLARLSHPSKKTVLLILAVIVITLIMSAMISIWFSKITNLKVPSIGTLMTLGVDAYWDENLGNKTGTVNWGVISPESSKNVTLYLRSVSNVKTILHLNATNWNPIGISGYMNLSWNYNGIPIDPGDVVQVTLVLSASSSYSFVEYLVTNNVKEFNFDIDIRAIEE